MLTGYTEPPAQASTQAALTARHVLLGELRTNVIALGLLMGGKAAAAAWQLMTEEEKIVARTLKKAIERYQERAKP